MIKGAGILFLSKKGTALFLKRGMGSADFPGYWDFPGGGREGEETAEECAIREATEEIGATFPADGKRVFHTRTAGSVPKGVAGVVVPTALPVQDGTTTDPAPEVMPPPELPVVDFATFLQRVDEQFTPELNDEHDGYAWAPIASPPEPLHPGCRIGIDRLAMNELGVARAIAAGQLVSPQKYENVWLFALRITGTDVAYRPKGDEFAVRDPALYLNDEFLARCNGLPVIWKHPKSALLNSEEFLSRIVGTVFLPYIAGAEVWAIAKIYVDEVAQTMAEGGLSTSPGVNFADWTVNKKLTLHMADGSKEKVLFEGDPSLLDHVAVCVLGVWDKGDEPTGIRSEAREDSAMADEEKKSKEDAKHDGSMDDSKKDAKKDETSEEKKEEKEESKDDSKKDAKKDSDGGSEIMDAICKVADAVAGLGKRMDAYESKDDSRKDAKKDESEEKKGEAKEPIADKKDAKKDSKKDEKEEEKERADSAARSAAELAKVNQRIEEVRSMIPKDMADADFEAITDAQSRADDVFVEFGQKAPRPLQGQSVMAYDRMVTKKLQDHSPTWKGRDLKAITDDAFPIIRDQIFSEAKKAAANPVNIDPGKLRMVEKKRDGHTIRDFYGRPGDWMNEFAGPVQMRGSGKWLHDGLGQARSN